MKLLIPKFISFSQNLLRKIKISFFMIFDSSKIKTIYLNKKNAVNSNFLISNLIDNYPGFKFFLDNISVVIQGPVLNDDLKKQLVDLFDNSNLIWINTAHKEDIFSLKNIKNFNNLNEYNFALSKKDILSNKISPQNLYLQCSSTIKGLSLIKKKKFILKVRSDINLDIELFIFYCFVNTFSSERLLNVSSFNSYKSPNYSISDMIVFGEYNKVKALFNRPILEKNFKFYNIGLSPEQIIFGLHSLNILDNNDDNFLEFIKNTQIYKNYLRNQIKIINSYLTGFRFSKNFTRDFTSTNSLTDKFLSASGKYKTHLTEEQKILFSNIDFEDEK